MEIPVKDDIKNPLNALFIEHHVQRIITQQEKNGVFFKKAQAAFSIHSLRERQTRLYHQIRPHLELIVASPYNKPISKPYLKSGEHSLSVKKWYHNQKIPDIGGQFTRVEFVEPDIGRRVKLLSQLLRLGWEPAHYTEKGNPKLTHDGEPCPSLRTISNDLGKRLAEWYTYRHREAQIAGLIRVCRGDRRISAQAITIGTPTFRFRHKQVVNIPRSTSLYGRQLRALFGIEDKRTRRLLGYDASGLELRMLANFINDDDFTKTVVEGKQEDGTDIHTRNQKDAGLPDRDTAKTFIYAFIYGAGDAKIGAIAGASRRVGKRIKQRFLRKNPRLADLIKNTELAAKRGYLIGLDGRRLRVRRDRFTGAYQTHKATNLLLQGAGATVMKWAMVILDLWIQQYNTDALKVIDMHDEGQLDVDKKQTKLIGWLATSSIVEAGKMLNLNVPLAADYKVGLSWAHTH